jgi:hypothetical protein
MTAVGRVSFRRRYWKCTCGSDGSYAVDTILGITGESSTLTVQRYCCELGADSSFVATSRTLRKLLGIELCPETVRKTVEGHGKRMARFQANDKTSVKAFRKAAGEVEFTTDAAKVNTREERWKDLKIGVISKREAGEQCTLEQWNQQRLPNPTITLAFAKIAPAKEFRKEWRSRLRQLGVRSTLGVHTLADGANWIWRGVQRVLGGCVQTLDIFHGCEHLHKCAEYIHGKENKQTKADYRRGQELLIGLGWPGVCQWVGELLSVDDDKERERRRKATDRLIGYFAKHTNRLNYADRLKAGRAIGSGQVEGKAKTLGLRLKRRGARWNRCNVEPMASLVCVYNSVQWDAYWAEAA